VRFDLARGAGGFAYIPDFLSGGGQRHHLWWICPPATRCGGWRTIHRAARPGFPREPWRASRFVIHGDG